MRRSQAGPVTSAFCSVLSLIHICKSDLIAEIAQNPEDGERVLDVLMIAKYLERIGDHATNIAEWVEFSITGSHKSAMHGAEAAAR